MAEYKNPSQISREEIIRIFSTGTNDEVCDALVSMAFYDEDWKWSQDQCLGFLNHPDANVRGVSTTCLGHIARIHHQLDQEQVISALKKCLKDKKVAGSAQDALDDIQMFLRK
jgi:hypothetical protein